MLVNSTLPLESLGKIWDLSDMDHDGALDRHEFIVVIKKFPRELFCFSHNNLGSFRFKLYYVSIILGDAFSLQSLG